MKNKTSVQIVYGFYQNLTAYKEGKMRELDPGPLCTDSYCVLAEKEARLAGDLNDWHT